MISFLIHCYILKNMPSRRVYTCNSNAHNATIFLLVPNHKVLNIEFWNAIKLLDQSMTNKNNQHVPVPRNRNGGSVATRIQHLVKKNHLSFTIPSCVRSHKLH